MRFQPKSRASMDHATGTDERQGGADRREEHACQRIPGVSKGEPDPDCRHERAGNGRPQTGEQAETRDDRQHRAGHCVDGPLVQRGNGARNERGSADEPHDEETHARPAASEGREEPAHNTPTRAYGIESGARNPRKGRQPILFRVDYSPGPMMPRLIPMIAAWVRSLAPSFDRMFLTRPLIVSSVTASRSAICLLALPAAISRRTSTSAGVSDSSVACSAS